MRILEFLRAYPYDAATVMTKKIVDEIADYIEELETRVRILEQQNDRIAITGSIDNQSTSTAESIQGS